jgi:hypothetical protein
MGAGKMQICKLKVRIETKARLEGAEVGLAFKLHQAIRQLVAWQWRHGNVQSHPLVVTYRAFMDDIVLLNGM